MIGKADRGYVHSHPASNDLFPIYGETHIEKSGIYRMWVQFQIDGKVLTEDFTVNVAQVEESTDGCTIMDSTIMNCTIRNDLSYGFPLFSVEKQSFSNFIYQFNPVMANNKDLWEHNYQNKNEAEVSWFQAYPKTSVALIESCHLPLDAPILDVGGGDSHLVDVLLDKGFSNIWILDISGNALEKAKTRLGKRAQLVHWIISDILDFRPQVKFDLWHDRAAFHFLTTEDKIARYIAIANEAIAGDGNLIVATFSEKGPPKCSGLEVRQYSESLLSEKFSPQFQKIKCITENHVTPFSTNQSFLFCKFKKKM